MEIDARNGHKDVIQLILDRGADPKKTSDIGWTPLIYAQCGGHVDIENMIRDKMM